MFSVPELKPRQIYTQLQPQPQQGNHKHQQIRSLSASQSRQDPTLQHQQLSPLNQHESSTIELQKDLSRYKYQAEIGSMMYTFGEIRHSLPETTQLVEDIIKVQIVQIILQTAAIARRRGSRYFSHEDLLFLIRRDKMKLNRLSAYLGWRKVRKIANRSGAAGGAGGSAPVDMMDDDLVEDTQQHAPQQDAETSRKSRKQRVKLAWSLFDQFDDILAVVSGGASDEEAADDEDADEDDQKEFFAQSRARLLKADKFTQAMTQQEYMDYADCRQASFTYKKPARFKEWLNIDQLTGMKPNGDLLDVFGFLCYEMVRTLTEQSLAVKKQMESKSAEDSPQQSSAQKSEHYVVDSDFFDTTIRELREQFRPYTVFSSPNERTPIEPVHVMEAHRRLSQNDALPIDGVGSETNSIRNNFQTSMRLFHGGLPITRRNLI